MLTLIDHRGVGHVPGLGLSADEPRGLQRSAGVLEKVIADLEGASV